MAKKIILISSCPICIILAVLAVVFVGIGRGQPAANPDVIGIELIEGDAAIDNIIADYNSNPNLASTLVNTARTGLPVLFASSAARTAVFPGCFPP